MCFTFYVLQLNLKECCKQISRNIQVSVNIKKDLKPLELSICCRYTASLDSTVVYQDLDYIKIKSVVPGSFPVGKKTGVVEVAGGPFHKGLKYTCAVVRTPLQLLLRDPTELKLFSTAK